MSTHVHRMPFGATVHADGADFALWAPSAEIVMLEHHAVAGGSFCNTALATGAWASQARAADGSRTRSNRKDASVRFR